MTDRSLPDPLPTDGVPSQAWYWLAAGSVALSLGLRVMGKKKLSTFVGQWPPTFLAFGIYHLVRRDSGESTS